MTDPAIFSHLCILVSDRLEVDPDTLEEGTKLSDLKARPVDLAELAMDVADAFGVGLDADLTGTLGEITAWVEKARAKGIPS